MTLDIAPLLGPRGRAFTDEQARAILDADGDLLLSAAAGSGKTSVLVERFVRHVLEEDVSPGRILAITFTEKAAGEMKQRVRERLLELAERDAAVDPAAARRAREAARESEGAWISTVHGFCARLLRGHAVTAGLDPGFAVLDEPSARALRDAAWDQAFSAWLEERGEPALDVAAAFTADRLRMAVVEVHDALRSAGDTAPRLPPVPPAPAPDPTALRAAQAAAAGELAAAEGKTVERARGALERCGEMLDAGDVVPGPEALGKAGFKPGSTKALQGAAVAAYLEAREAFASACARHRAGATLAELDDLLRRYGSAYAAGKRAGSALDFDDLELLARDLLRDAPTVRDALRERFERMLVDEFQDSNPLQVELFDLLAGAPQFTVGDELQSIYGFRHADVGVFRARRARLAEAGRALALTVNFRSHPEILDVVNAAFAERMGEGFAPLVPGVEATPAASPRVELLITGTTGWEDVDLGALPRAQAWRHAEARLVAQRMRELVDAGEARPEEIVVLVRSTGDLPVYERALEDAGLQTMASGGRGYWGRQVVRDLCAWLAALANPRDEQALFGVLASPLVGASTDALALIAQSGTGRAWRTIEAAFPPAPEGPGAPAPADGLAPEGPGAPAPSADAAAPEGAATLAARLAPADRERLAAFRDRFAAERGLAARLALDALLRRAIEASDYDLHVLRLPGGARRMANVHKLLRLAAEHERAHGADVRGFIDRANAELEVDAREADAPVELGDARAVRLMTIHAAKGLEFPVVCVADLGRRTTNDAPALLVRDGAVGVRLSHLDGSSEHALDYVALRDRRRAEERAEEDRILYVALTRAERRLVLSGGVDVTKWPGDTLGAPPIAWLGQALLDGLAALPGEEEPDVEATTPARLRCALNTPATVGRVLRSDFLAPAGAELPPAPPPPARPPLPVATAPAPGVRSLSYTALQQWRRCGYRFYLEKVLHLPQEDAPVRRTRAEGGGLEGRVRGILVHDTLERLPPERLTAEGPGGAGDGDITRLLSEAASRERVEPGAEELRDLAALVTGFTSTPLAARIAAAAEVRREHPFTLPLGPALLTGVVDVLAVEADGTALVVDYKTDRLAPDTATAALVDRDYGVQRRAYALAALRAGHAAVEVAYAFLERPDEPVALRFTAADADRLEEELSALAGGALGGHFPVAETPHADLCAGCPGRRALCVHPEELTGRELPPAGPELPLA